MTKFAIDCPTFGNSFGKSLGDASDIESLSNVLDIPLPPNLHLSANPFA